MDASGGNMADRGLSDEGTSRREFAAATTNLEMGRELAAALGGVFYADEREHWQHLPFRGLVTVAGSHADALQTVGDVGLYRVERRVVKPGKANVFGLFPMVRAAGLTHLQADAHWRDVHGPLALTHHGHMVEYVQLNVVETISGAPFDGFALCGFVSEDDLRNRFYSTAEGPGVIARDVACFSDLERSPRRLIASAERFAV
jgi:hypothetical protein